MRRDVLKLVFALAGVMCAAMCHADEPDRHVLVVNDSGYYLMVTPQNAAPRFEKIDVVINMTANGPTTPTDPDTPAPGDPIAERAYNLAASIGNRQDAATVSAVYGFFAEQLKTGKMTVDGFRTGFDAARRITSQRLKGDWSGAFASFDKDASPPMLADDLAAALQSISDGCGRFVNTSAASIMADANDVPEDIEVAGILALIKAIMELLKLFGVLAMEAHNVLNGWAVVV